MSATLLRAGLWLILIVLAGFVIRETNPGTVWEQYLPPGILQTAGAVGIVMVLTGIVMSFMGKAASKIPLSRCQVCHRSVMKGEIYCREHLRQIREEDVDRSHGTLPRRRQ